MYKCRVLRALTFAMCSGNQCSIPHIRANSLCFAPKSSNVRAIYYHFPVTMEERFAYALDDTHLNLHVRQALFAPPNVLTGRPPDIVKQSQRLWRKYNLFGDTK